MEIICKTEILKSAVSRLSRITNKNTQLPVLSAILFNFDKNKLILRSTNLDVGAEITVDLNSNNQNMDDFAVPSDILNNLLLQIDNNGDISINKKNENIEIKYKSNIFNIKCFQPYDFPTIPRIKDFNEFRIDIKKITDSIKSVSYSASLSDIKPELSSVFMYSESDNLVFVSTDSFRLSEKKIKNKENKEIEGIIIPLKNSIEIIKFFEQSEGEANILYNKNQITIILNNTYFTSRVIDGVFPDYKQIMPKKHNTEAVLLKYDILNALKISNIFSDKLNQVNIVIKPKENNISINTNNSDIGNGNILLDAALSGDDIDININYKYIMDCLQYIKQDSILIQTEGNNKPIMIKGVNDNSYTCLIMPMNK